MPSTTASAPIKKLSLTHKVLSMSKFYNRPITYQDLYNLNPKFSVRGADPINRSLVRLEKLNFIQRHDKKTWSITPAGIRFLSEFAYRHKTVVSD